MTEKHIQSIIEILNLLCPYLKGMAERTDNIVDDFIIHSICRLIQNVDPSFNEEDTKL